MSYGDLAVKTALHLEMKNQSKKNIYILISKYTRREPPASHLVIAAGGLEQLHQLLHGGWHGGYGRRARVQEVVLEEDEEDEVVLLLEQHSLRNHGEDRTSNRTSISRTAVLCAVYVCVHRRIGQATTGFG